MPKGKTVILDRASLELLTTAFDLCQELAQAAADARLQVDFTGAKECEHIAFVLAREAVQLGIMARNEKERLERERRIAELERVRSERAPRAGGAQ